MVRSVILRLPVVRALLPRISQPLLPLTSRFTLGVTRTPAQSQQTRLFQHFPARLSASPPPSPTGSSNPDDPDFGLPPNASLSQRLKHLIKAYGWYALGVYIFFSVADFSVAFAAINVIGAEHVARVATSVKEYIAAFLPSHPPEPGREQMDPASSAPGGQEGLYAMLVLAYTVHKTLFLPVRIGLTAAFTPRLVRWLRTRGWAGSAGTRRAANEVREKIRNRRESRDRD